MPWSLLNRSGAMNARIRASSSTSILKSSVASVGHRITGRYPGAVNRHLGIGWEFVQVCIDDPSRVAFVQVRANQRKENAVAFLEAAVAFFCQVIRVEHVVTDMWCRHRIIGRCKAPWPLTKGPWPCSVVRGLQHIRKFRLLCAADIDSDRSSLAKGIRSRVLTRLGRSQHRFYRVRAFGQRQRTSGDEQPQARNY
jgi:hypothetical protein